MCERGAVENILQYLLTYDECFFLPSFCLISPISRGWVLSQVSSSWNGVLPCSGVTLWVSMAESQNTFRFSSNELFQLSVTGRVDASAVSNAELLFGEIT